MLVAEEAGVEEETEQLAQAFVTPALPGYTEEQVVWQMFVWGVVTRKMAPPVHAAQSA